MQLDNRIDLEEYTDHLLTMLSEFGCFIDCATDTDFDESVGVGDLMNILTVFGQGCSSE